MKKDNHKIDVIFRVDNSKDFKGVVYALFPYDISDKKGSVTSYQHVGQHSSADYNHCIKTSKPASEKDYADLKKELESIGYNINVVKKRNYDKYLKNYKSLK